jgi:hypothetical protein
MIHIDSLFKNIKELYKAFNQIGFICFYFLSAAIFFFNSAPAFLRLLLQKSAHPIKRIAIASNNMKTVTTTVVC